jgi:bilirubin oxidase
MKNIYFIHILAGVLLNINAFSQNPLFIPPALNGPVFNLNVISDSTEFFSGHQTPTYGINQNILAPTLIFNKGETVTLHVTNNLNNTTTMHWHGMHVPAIADGGPHQVINPGDTWSPSFKIMNDAATYWYHPHGNHKTDLQVSRGLAGMIIVKDSAETALALPRTYGVDDFPLIVQTKCFDVLYQTAIATIFDTVPMVNATIDPMLDVPAQVVRLRILNGASERSFMFGFSNNMNFSLIGTDGGLLNAPVSMNRLRLSTGERAEILFDLSGMQGQTINLMNYGSELPDGIIGALNVGTGAAQIPDYNQNFLNGADFILLQLNMTAQTPAPVTAIPASLVTSVPSDSSIYNRTRTIVFDPETQDSSKLVEGPFTLNGNQFDMHTVNDTVYLNHIEKWSLINNTLIAHPFHIHDVQFYITEFNGGPVPPEQSGKKDVVLVMPQQSVSFITRFEDFADTVPYMYHCHLLHHEDDGMMGSFIVIDSGNVSIDQFDVSSQFIIYPNPSADRIINLSSRSDLIKMKYELTDVVGKLIHDGIISDNKINMQSVPDGIYFLRVTGPNFQHTGKIILH